jgi:NAD(P)-dependent dehydrogenase (short-subunit alcohol dehydrogenase family)
MHLDDRIAVVTGGASGIGCALCQELARKNATVIVSDIDSEGADRVSSAILEAGGKAEAFCLDVSQAEAVENLVAHVVTTYGRLDYMFNNAGIGIAGDVRDMELEDWQNVVDVNLWGVIHGTMSAYRVMAKQGFGHIVNTASGGGLIPLPMGVAYSTTKYGVVGLSTSLRAEAAGLGVKVSVVCPGGVRTNIIETVKLLKIDREKLLSRLPKVLLMDADKCARIVLRGVARNKGIITVTAFVRVGWWLYRFQPALFDLSARTMARGVRGLREN